MNIDKFKNAIGGGVRPSLLEFEVTLVAQPAPIL